jgi:hypothetical protein
VLDRFFCLSRVGSAVPHLNVVGKNQDWLGQHALAIKHRRSYQEISSLLL